MSPQVEATAAGRRWRPFAELLADADRDSVAWRREFDPQAALRRRYCGVTDVGTGGAEPCASCGGPSSTLVGDLPLHLLCPDPDPVRASQLARAAQPVPAVAARASGRAAAAEQQPAAVEAAEDLAGVLAADGLWLPGADSPVRVTLPASVGDAYDLAARFRLRQLWIHPGAHAALRLPDEHGPNPQAADDHPWTRAPGFECDPPGLAVWLHVRPEGEGRRRAVVLPAYEHRAAWRAASSGKVLLDGLLRLAGVLPKGCNYYYSPNETAAAVIRHHARGGLDPMPMPPPAEDHKVTHVASWSRTLMDEEADRAWLHRYDTNGAQLAVWNVKLGTGGAAVHHSSPVWAPKRSKYTGGYWLISVEEGWRPDPRLPDLLIPWRRRGESHVWVPTPFLELLADDLHAPVTIAEAWLWPQSSAWLEAAGHSLRDARAALIPFRDTDEAAALALKAVKTVYTSQIGNFAHRPSTGDGSGGAVVAAARANPLYRPDATDHIISKAMANDYRRMARIGRTSGRWPVAIFNDAAYYASDEPDAGRAAPAGMKFGDGLGEYSVETAGTVPLPAVARELGERNFHSAVERVVKGRP